MRIFDRTIRVLIASLLTLGMTGCLDWDEGLLVTDGGVHDAADGAPRDGRADARDARPNDAERDADGPMADSGDGPLPDSGDGPLPDSGDGPLPDTGDGPLPDTGDGPLPDSGSDGSDGLVDAPPSLLTNGSSCPNDDACKSGHCADGVCCNSACSADCESCALTGSEGDCRPVPDGQSPSSGKTCVPGTGCGLDGKCDGSGSCRYAAAGTICQQAKCTLSTRELARVCDGAGACATLTTTPLVSCAPYSCDNALATCKFTCTKKNDCTTNSCTALVCAGGGRPQGSPCSSGGVCESGQCVDGVCCESACNGTCETCALPGLEGRCVAIPAGQPEPSGACAPSGPCGNDGSCDGTGGCRVTPAGTPCGATACVTGAVDDLLRRLRCDGAGACQAVESSCGPYRCQPGIGSCYGRCEVTGQCKVGSCSGGRCQ